LRQSNVVSLNQAIGQYARVNDVVIAAIFVQANASGTSNNRIEIDLPVAAASTNRRVIGNGAVRDASLSDFLLVSAVQYSTTRVAFFTNASTSLTTYLGQTGGPTLTLANSDSVQCLLVYEAA
jgi:heme O synthase-like polyprenyltransferase